MEEIEEISGNQQLPILRLRSGSGTYTVHYPLLYQGFPDEFKRVAEKVLKETDEKKKKGIERLKEFINRKNLLKTDDNTLVAVLRSCKYDLKKSEAKLKTFLSKRQEIVDMVAAIDMDKVERIVDDTGFGFLPYRTRNGAVIGYTRPYGINSNLYGSDEVAAVGMSALLLFLSHPITSTSGIVYFGDCKSPSIYFWYTVCKEFRRFLGHVLALPIRAKKVEFLNANSLARWSYKILRPLVPEKIYRRAEFHDDSYDKIHKAYDPNLIPDVFEGNLGPLSNKHCKQAILDYIMKLKAESL